MEGVQMGLMKEERDSHCFPKLGSSSWNNREQTPLLDVLQRVAGPPMEYPETPTAQIFTRLPNPISKLGWRMATLLFKVAQTTLDPMKGTKVVRRSLAECSRLHETQRLLENMTEGKCFFIQEGEDLEQLYDI